ncbi:HAD-like domain-containing protein [Pelagophyceae sp. CCMP2097]|nr:HAD-like domain-containing protein [Pelagophyceae sp. CCMP2097]
MMLQLLLRRPGTVLRRHFSAVSGVAQLLQKADAVCFDFDSTLITEEGIDVLAEHCGKGAAVAEWTRKAMGGGVPFEDALAARLDLIRPSTADVRECLAKHAPVATPSVVALCELLRARGQATYVISGGLRSMIEPMAVTELGFPLANIYANTLFWDASGNYTGFDAGEPTSRDGGKAAVVAALKKKFGYETVIMIGDGATDLQAKPPADAVIGYGGVVEREAVRAGADWFVLDFATLLDALREEEKA